MWVWTGARSSSRLIITSSCDCSVIATRSGKTEAGRQDCIHIFSTRKDVFPKFTMQVFCSFLSIPMCGKSRKHSFNTEVIVDSSISRAWTPHANFLSDMNDPFWECWYTLSKLTNQRVYQELVYRKEPFEEMITGSAALPLPSFLSFFFSCSRFLNSEDPNISDFAYG